MTWRAYADPMEPARAEPSRGPYLRMGQAEPWIRLLGHMPVSAIVTDPAGIVTHWNRYAESLFGWSAAETIGRPVERFVIASEDADALRVILDAVMHRETWEGPVPATRRAGTRTVIHVVDAPILHDDNDEVLAVVCLSVNIADSLRAERHRATDVVGDALGYLATSSDTTGGVALPQVGTSALSQREIEILSMLRGGRRTREIAQQLSISYSTVRNHIASIYRKLGVHSRTELLQLIDRKTTPTPP